jgi:hypothetical protein
MHRTLARWIKLTENGGNSVGLISWRGMQSAVSAGPDGLSVLGAIAQLRREKRLER